MLSRVRRLIRSARTVLSSVTPGEVSRASSEPTLPSAFSLYDLVDRSPPTVRTEALRAALQSKTVLVTGAGGSIGSELALQLLRLGPQRLDLVDVSEHNLYELQRTLERHDDANVARFWLRDLRDRSRTAALVDRVRPDVVVHAAAYKHVPMMEQHPREAFENNTLATAYLVNAAETNGVDTFVFISTDKAVHPVNVLGATKQRAEEYVRAQPPETTSPRSGMKTYTVRFGNVFGSAGSVVPYFEECLRHGNPLPVTHPDMERYFMSTDEACALVLQTLLLDASPIYLLRMGDPVRIVDLARALIRHHRPDVDPDAHIRFVGARPGEKRAERLVADHETVSPTSHPDVLGVTPSSSAGCRGDLDATFEALLSDLDRADTPSDVLHALLRSSSPPASSSSSRTDGSPSRAALHGSTR